MEIITYPVSGIIAHKDSTGTQGLIHAGEIQKMSAGSGINTANSTVVIKSFIYTVWIEPNSQDVAPSYDQRQLPERVDNTLQLMVSGDEADGVMHMHADSKIYSGRFQAGETLTQHIDVQRAAWLQVVRGEVAVGEHRLSTSDGLAGEDETELTIEFLADSEVLFLTCLKTQGKAPIS